LTHNQVSQAWALCCANVIIRGISHRRRSGSEPSRTRARKSITTTPHKHSIWIRWPNCAALCRRYFRRSGLRVRHLLCPGYGGCCTRAEARVTSRRRAGASTRGTLEQLSPDERETRENWESGFHRTNKNQLSRRKRPLRASIRVNLSAKLLTNFSTTLSIRRPFVRL